MREFVKIIFLCCTFCFGIAQNRNAIAQSKEPTDGWRMVNKLSPVLDSLKISELIKVIEESENGVESLLIAKNDTLLLDAYFKGYSPEEPHDIRSVNKSLKAILVGIAVDQGFIEDINDPIWKYLKSKKPQKNLSELKSQITIAHLLTMSNGLECNDWDKKSKGQEDKVYRKKDWLQYTLDLPMAREPGQEAAYCSMGTLLLAEIVEQTSGLTLQAFAEKYLLEPLSIANYRWGHTSNGNVVSSGKRLYLTPRDMAKIGLLILNKGTWQGKQIVSEDWVNQMTQTQTQLTGLNYGYLWWILPFSDESKLHFAKVAMGNGGQYIFVLPELDVIVVFTGNAFNSEKDKLPFAWVRNYILPALKT